MAAWHAGRMQCIAGPASLAEAGGEPWPAGSSCQSWHVPMPGAGDAGLQRRVRMLNSPTLAGPMVLAIRESEPT